MKNKELGSITTNFRPTTCLPLIWKLLTGILADELYQHLESKELLPEEQKGCRRDARGTKDQLLIDKTILKNCRRRLTGLGMAWIDFKKAFDMVPHSWIIKCMTIFGVASNVTKLLENSMKGWRTELSSGGVRLGDVNIRRGIFQGDSFTPLLFVLSLIPLTLLLRKVKAGYDLGDKNGVINHLLFMDDLKVYGKNQNQVDTLVQTIRVVTTDMRMEFGINKCAMLIMKRGRLTHSEGITLPDNLQIRRMKEDDDGYKYLGVLEVEGIKHLEMKELVRKEYFRRVKKILKSKLNGGNTIKAINSRAVSIIRYGAGIVDWTKEELQEMDWKTRKLLIINRALHPQKRLEGGRGMIGVEDCATIETNSLMSYIEQHANEKALKALAREQVLKVRREGIDKKSLREASARTVLSRHRKQR